MHRVCMVSCISSTSSAVQDRRVEVYGSGEMPFGEAGEETGR